MAEEQLTREDLEKMSPERLAELQRQQCIFCQIVSGKIPSRTLFEDDRVKVVLDINPAAPGHAMILPKAHIPILPMADDVTLRHLGVITKRVSLALLRTLKAEGTTWLVHNGAAAGQRAPHAIIHVIPRMEGDGLELSPEGEATQDQTLRSRLKDVALAVVGGNEPGHGAVPPPRGGPDDKPIGPAPAPSPAGSDAKLDEITHFLTK